MMTVRQMLYFDALGRTLHFGRAAEMAGVSQPAISAQIAQFEAELGTRLVERTRGAIVLTETGRRLLPRIRQILHDIAQIEQEIAGGDAAQPLRVGVIPTVAPYLLVHLIPLLARAQPDIDLHVREAVTEALVQDLIAGDLDAIIAATPIRAAPLRHTPLFRDRFVMAVSSNARDVLVSPLSPSDVSRERLLLLEDGHCLRDQALSVCTSGAQRQLVSYGATSLATLLQMVGHDMGQTLLPEIAIESETARNPAIRIVRFDEPEPARQIALFWRSGYEHRALLDGFAGAVREVAQPLLVAAD